MTADILPLITQTISLVFIGVLTLMCLKRDRQVVSLKKDNDLLKENVDNYVKELERASGDYNRAIESMKVLTSQKSAIATKSGLYFETMAPLLKDFPVDIYNRNVSVKWLGDAVDYIAIDFDKPMISFIEVKSGDSILSSRQKLIKKMIKEGLIEFREVRLNSDGKTEIK